MKAIKRSAKQKVLKKLSALRATLPNDEREVLDNIMVGEVNAHRVVAKKAVVKSKAKAMEVNAHKVVFSRVAARVAVKSKAKAKEVSAHKLALTKVAARTTAKFTAKAKEVNAHRLVSRKANAKITAKQMRVAFDATTEQYTPIED